MSRLLSERSRETDDASGPRRLTPCAPGIDTNTISRAHTHARTHARTPEPTTPRSACGSPLNNHCRRHLPRPIPLHREPLGTDVGRRGHLCTPDHLFKQVRRTHTRAHVKPTDITTAPSQSSRGTRPQPPKEALRDQVLLARPLPLLPYPPPKRSRTTATAG